MPTGDLKSSSGWAVGLSNIVKMGYDKPQSSQISFMTGVAVTLAQDLLIPSYQVSMV